MTEEDIGAPQYRATWFGPVSFRSAAVLLTLNTIPLFIYFYTIFVLFPVYVIELIAAAFLFARRGRARQFGVGIAFALLGTAGFFALFSTLGRLL